MFTVDDAHRPNHETQIPRTSRKIKGCAGVAHILEANSTELTEVSLGSYGQRIWRGSPRGAGSATVSVVHDCRQNVFIQQFNFRRGHLGRLEGSIEDNDRVEFGDNDGLLTVEAECGHPFNAVAFMQ